MPKPLDEELADNGALTASHTPHLKAGAVHHGIRPKVELQRHCRGTPRQRPSWSQAPGSGERDDGDVRATGERRDSTVEGRQADLMAARYG